MLEIALEGLCLSFQRDVALTLADHFLSCQWSCALWWSLKDFYCGKLSWSFTVYNFTVCLMLPDMYPSLPVTNVSNLNLSYFNALSPAPGQMPDPGRVLVWAFVKLMNEWTNEGRNTISGCGSHERKFWAFKEMTLKSLGINPQFQDMELSFEAELAGRSFYKDHMEAKTQANC